MTLLKKANKAFLHKKYKIAAQHYIKAQSQFPRLKKITNFNLKLIERKFNPQSTMPKLEEIQKLPLSILVISWDVSHNAVGRAYMLAEVLTRTVDNVTLIGFQFPSQGDGIWEPVRNASIPVIPFYGENFPDILDSFEHIIDQYKPDVVLACKPRVPSLELGIMFKKKYNIPLILDIDDYELSFFDKHEPLTVAELKNFSKEDLTSDIFPFSETWTRIAENLCKCSDEIIVSNKALNKKFGGSIVPHVRNEKAFNPIFFNKIEQREKYNIPINAKVVMFFGTPREHKGVSTLAKLIGDIDDDTYMLVVVGSSPQKSLFDNLDELSTGKIMYLPNQPFNRIPEIISMADAICLIQEEGHVTSKFQLPAKAIDAIGMGIPLFVSNTEPLMQLVDDGVAKLVTKENMRQVIKEELNTGRTKIEELELRRCFLEKYSYHSATLSMKNIIQRVIDKKPTDLTIFDELLEYQKVVFKK